MKIKVFTFNRIQKNPKDMMLELNNFLANVNFKGVIQNEASHNGKIILTVSYLDKTEGSSKDVQATVVRTQTHSELEKQLNDVLEQIEQKVYTLTQSLSANTITTIIFHGV